MSHQQIELTKLVFNEDLYPRTGIDEQHVRQFMRAMEAGITLPPIVVAKTSNVIVDGVHRYHAHLRREVKKIAATVKTYKNNAELWHDAVLLNSGTGLRLGTDDALKVIAVSEKFGLKEIEIAALLRTSISHLRTLKPRYATVGDARADVSKLRRIGLKGSVRHLAGQTISTEQAEAMIGAPGQSYLLNVNQLISAFEHDLLPSAKDHPTLWAALTRLGKLIEKETRKMVA